MQNKLWIHKQTDKNDIDRLSNEAGISKLLAKVFISRGIQDAHYVDDFLNPCIEKLYDPFLLKDMAVAADRIIKAVESGEQIVIYGDYDVDGVTSTAVVYNFLSSVGANAGYYIPDRLDEGYGLSVNAIEKVRNLGAALVITVDCGITAVEEVKYINSCNMQVIITDHHQCREALPEALAVINPRRPDCTYPFKELAGVGVAFKLVHALCLKMNLGSSFLRYIDLVTLGTIADVVPLSDENRIIVKNGLSVLEKSDNKGINALMKVAALGGKAINSYTVAFAIAPRINAAGRIGSALRSVKLFTVSDEQQADEIAIQLNEENRYRQDMEMEIIQQAIAFVEECVDLKKEKIIVASAEGWHHGIIGIAASKIAERYYRPCILISEEDGMGKGSGRSIEGFNLFKALLHCENLLEKFGGHEMAAGLSIKLENLTEFKRLINEYADTVLTAADLIPCIKIDATIKKDDISLENVRELELLAPFGSGNPGPVFAYDGFKINEIRTVGENKHLKLRLEDNGLNLDAIGFYMGELAESYCSSDILDTVFTLEINTWNNYSKVQLNLKDIRLNEEKVKEHGFFFSLDKYIVFNESNDYNRNNGMLDSLSSRKLEEIIPERADLAAVYQLIREYTMSRQDHKSENRLVIDDLFLLSRKITNRYKLCMNYFKLKKSLEIFDELKLLKIETTDDSGMVVTVFDNGKGKTKLEESSLYKWLQGLKKEC